MVAISKAAAIEDGPFGIRVNAIRPGFIVTNMSKGAENSARDPREGLPDAGRPARGGRGSGGVHRPDRASFVTGAVIPVDGGWIAKVA